MGRAGRRSCVLAAVMTAAVVAVVVPRHAAARGCPPPQAPPVVHLVTRPRWVPHVLVTEYFPAPERFFRGRLVAVPGLPGRHRIDWLYSARGLAMQGEGIGRDGSFYHFAGPYTLTWRDARGAPTLPCPRAPGHWTDGRPVWIGPTWLNRTGEVTYPLPAGRWSAGPARRREPAPPARFAAGRSLSLVYWRDVAVDPRLIAYGSRVFVRAYCSSPNRGWFVAADTGGAIIGPHLDVFRAPPARAWTSRVLRDQKVFVVPPGDAAPRGVGCR